MTRIRDFAVGGFLVAALSTALLAGCWNTSSRSTVTYDCFKSTCNPQNWTCGSGGCNLNVCGGCG